MSSSVLLQAFQLLTPPSYPRPTLARTLLDPLTSLLELEAQCIHLKFLLLLIRIPFQIVATLAYGAMVPFVIRYEVKIGNRYPQPSSITMDSAVSRCSRVHDPVQQIPPGDLSLKTSDDYDRYLRQTRHAQNPMARRRIIERRCSCFARCPYPENVRMKLLEDDFYYQRKISFLWAGGRGAS